MQQTFKTFNDEMKVYDVDLDLLQAVENNNIGRMNDALALGADPACIDKDGRTPLNAAVSRGYNEIAKALIDAGAPLNDWGKSGLSPLRAAMKGGHLSSVELLVAEKANPHCVCVDPDVAGKMPDYLYAEKYCSPEIAAAVGTIANRLSFLMAVSNNSHWKIEEYVKKGTPVDTEIEPGKTCLLFAAGRGWAEMVRKLAEYGADVQKAGPDGQTPMHAASIAKSVETIEALSELGGKVYVTDGQGKTSLAYAQGPVAEALQRCAEKEVQFIMRPAPIKAMPALKLRPKL
jgi:ankyrin repeat protein